MPFSLISTLRELPLAFVDVETSGASCDLGHRVIEVGVVRFENGQQVSQYTQLINPQRRISSGVTVLTGITQQMVEDQPTFAEQFDPMMQHLGGAVVLGHNIRFDLAFLGREFRRCGRDIENALDRAPVIDTVRIARRRFGRGGNGLQRLARRLGYEPSTAHRALPDALTTAVVFAKLLEPVGGLRLCLCDVMAQQGGAMHLAPKSASLLPLELEEAIDQRAPVKLEYLDGNDARTQRIVQPLRLKRRNGEMVLVAHCQLRNEQRTFKLDRILEVAKMTDCQLAVGDGETLWDNAHNHAAGARMPASDSEVQGQQR